MSHYKNFFVRCAFLWLGLYIFHMAVSAVVSNGYQAQFAGVLARFLDAIAFNFSTPAAFLWNVLPPLIPFFVALLVSRWEGRQVWSRLLLGGAVAVLLALQIWKLIELTPCMLGEARCPSDPKSQPPSAYFVMGWLFFIAPLLALPALFAAYLSRLNEQGSKTSS